MSKEKSKLDSTYAKAEESPGYLLWKAANLLQRSHAAVLRELDSTPAQFSLMTCLVYLAKDGGITSAQIAKHAGMDKMMVSDLVKTLTKKGLIRTLPNPADGRSFLIEATREGLALTNKAVRKVEAIDEAFFRLAEIPKAFLGHLQRIVSVHAEPQE